MSMCLIVLVLLSTSCQKNIDSEGMVTLKIVSIGNTTTEHYKITSKTTALQLLKTRHNVTLNLGSRAVKCIDNVCASSGYWWPMYTNGKISTLGINAYYLKKGDEIEFKFAMR